MGGVQILWDSGGVHFHLGIWAPWCQLVRHVKPKTPGDTRGVGGKGGGSSTLPALWGPHAAIFYDVFVIFRNIYVRNIQNFLFLASTSRMFEGFYEIRKKNVSVLSFVHPPPRERFRTLPREAKNPIGASSDFFLGFHVGPHIVSFFQAWVVRFTSFTSYASSCLYG